MTLVSTAYHNQCMHIRHTVGCEPSRVGSHLTCYSNSITSHFIRNCRNIKHAFYQPAENEMICLVHFHLINPIMVAKKKTQDVQCYAEVMDSVQTLDAGRRSMYDPDEIEEEQREREQRNKVLPTPSPCQSLRHL